MRVLIVAIGQRLPDWAQAACDDYLRRFGNGSGGGSDWRVDIKALKAEPRPAHATPAATGELLRREAARIRQALPARSLVAALDEHGDRLTTTQLADWLGRLRDDAQSVAFIIGGADGLDADVKREAARRIRLSDMTLPHALARVLLIEQLYRAQAWLAGHPYHRE